MERIRGIRQSQSNIRTEGAGALEVAGGKLEWYPVESLLLDQNNPRFAEPVNSQKAALHEQLALAPTKILNLARDIADQGSLNPTELPVVVQENSLLVIIEGNRRLAALKLLAKPDLAGEYAEAFKAMRDGKALVTDVLCFQATSREAARHWLDLRHTGENDGAGVVAWESWQTNNFRRRPGTQVDRATQFCKAVESDYPEDAELLANIAAVRQHRLTTLGRLVSDPHVRHAYGFDFADGQVIFHFASEDLRNAIRRIFSDLAGPIGVSAIKNKRHREEYVESTRPLLPPRASRLDQPREAGTPANSVREVAATTSPTPPTSPTPTKRKQATPEKVIFQGLTLYHVDSGTSNLLKQAQSIDIDFAPGVAGVMIRVIIELIVTEAGLKFSKPLADNEKLQRKLRAALLQLDANCENPVKRDKSLEMAWVRSQSSEGGVAVQLMHAFVHNFMGEAAPSEARSLSKTFRVVLERLDGFLGSK